MRGWTTNNVSHRSGLPKKAETFYFFEIDKNQVDAFRARLHKVVPLIASDKSVSSGRDQIRSHKKHHSQLLSVAFANISFSSKGLNKVRAPRARKHSIFPIISGRWNAD